jgi:hypothetical protein
VAHFAPVSGACPDKPTHFANEEPLRQGFFGNILALRCFDSVLNRSSAIVTLSTRDAAMARTVWLGVSDNAFDAP